MPANCVVLDIGGVLEVPPAKGWMQRWEEDVGLAAGSTEDRLADIIQAGLIGQMCESEVADAVRVALPVDADSLKRFWSLWWQDYLGLLNVEMYEWFRGLRPRCKTGILSNSFVGAREREAERYGFPEACDVLVYSHEVGLVKPDPRVYQLTAQRLDVSPKEIVFVDDIPEFVDAACAAGWQAIRFVTTAQAIHDVEACL